ncbi:hypothetical protein EC957_000579 [Mortierella hygrophila]|uniref:Uncharacterized protein n=1 Tax=Mortierella hygrophila TaxID=979708 RepID=A0A9P6F6R7_9FUNG|nr:hypothetical protein EC957_000579 [Mortierella hygrophila]
MGAFSQERFSSLRQRLLNLTFNTPSERFGYKILLVIDEAQNLSKEKFGIFPSERTPSETGRRAGADLPDVYKRPILSPLVHGLNRISADENHFCVVPCGTDFSALDMNWLEGAAPGPKGYSRMLRPFTDFRGWESLEQVQNYRDLVRRSLPNDKARIIFDTQHMMTPNNGGIDWRLATKETEDALSSTESRYCGRGNIVFEISRMIRRVHNFEPQYAQYQNIKTTLKAFVLEHYLHGSPLLLDTEEAPLLEASVGRAHDLDGYTKTVLDEPIALRAAVNYFRRYDPEFYSAICTLLGLGSNASVHGYQLEMVVLPSLAHVFHGKILSHTGLVPEGEKSCDPILNGKAKIAGYVNHLALGTDPETMSLDAFLDAHVHHGSYKDGKTVPPFYLPAETPSGPDVAFVLRLDNQGYCPVFVQLKMRHKMTRPERQSKFSTVKADGVQGYLQEAMLQPFCTGYPQRFLGVAIDYPAKFADVEGTFPDVRRNEKIRSTQGDIPQCISLRIDKNNIHDLFPQNHTQALDMLKGIMRQLDQSYWLWE